MLDNGYLILPRLLIQSPLWKDSNASIRSVIIACLIKANYKDDVFNGIPIPRGSFITTSRNFSQECKMHRRTMRDCLDYLSTAHFIALDTAHHYTIVKVLDYNILQKVKDSLPPTNTPTDSPNLVHLDPQLGTFGSPTWYNRAPQVIKKNKKNNKNKLNNNLNIRGEENNTAQSIPESTIKKYRSLFPWNEREDLKASLIKGGMPENEAGKVLERTYPLEYTGKAV